MHGIGRTILLLAIPLTSAFKPSLLQSSPAGPGKHAGRLHCAVCPRVAMSTQNDFQDLPSGRTYMSEAFTQELLADRKFRNVPRESMEAVATTGSLTRRLRVARMTELLLRTARSVGTRVLDIRSKTEALGSSVTRRVFAAKAPVFVPTPRTVPPPPPKKAATVPLTFQQVAAQPAFVPSTVTANVGGPSGRMDSLLRGYAKKHGGFEDVERRTVNISQRVPLESEAAGRIEQLFSGYAQRHGQTTKTLPVREGTRTLMAPPELPRPKLQRSKYANVGRVSAEEGAAHSARVIVDDSPPAGTVRADTKAGVWTRSSGLPPPNRRVASPSIAFSGSTVDSKTSRLDQLVSKLLPSCSAVQGLCA